MNDKTPPISPPESLVSGVGIAILIITALLSILVAVQARRRGYRVTVWVVVGMLANPVYLLILLATMPDFARKRLRERFRTELDAKLAGRSGLARLPAASGPTAGTFTASPDLSVGDRMTALPRDRSLGDEETRA